MNPERIQPIETETRVPVSLEEMVRRIRMLADLREKEGSGETLNAKEARLLTLLASDVDAWLTQRFAARKIPPREVPTRVAQWIAEGAQKKEEKSDYEKTEWEWLEAEKKKPEGGRDHSYEDRLSVYCMLVEDAALARKWLMTQKKIFGDEKASPLARTRARDVLRAVKNKLDTSRVASVHASAPEADATQKSPVRPGQRESKTVRIDDVWPKIIKAVVWPPHISYELRESIGGRYGAQENGLKNAIRKRDKAEAEVQYADLAQGLRALAKRGDDALGKVIEDILNEVRQHVDRLPGEGEITDAVVKIKGSTEYRSLSQRFQKLLRPGSWPVARRFVREAMYPKLKKVYNGTVPEEAYTRLLAELEVEVQKLENLHEEKKKEIAARAARRRHAAGKGEPRDES